VRVLVTVIVAEGGVWILRLSPGVSVADIGYSIAERTPQPVTRNNTAVNMAIIGTCL